MAKKERMQNLIVIGHPDEKSFCYNGIFKTIKKTLLEEKGYLNEIEVIDLYRDSFARPRTDLIDKYKELVKWADRIYFVSPVWWFRLTPRMEIFFDEVLTPGYAKSRSLYATKHKKKSASTSLINALLNRDGRYRVCEMRSSYDRWFHERLSAALPDMLS